jgi:hypothetical protein
MKRKAWLLLTRGDPKTGEVSKLGPIEQGTVMSEGISQEAIGCWVQRPLQHVVADMIDRFTHHLYMKAHFQLLTLYNTADGNRVARTGGEIAAGGPCSSAELTVAGASSSSSGSAVGMVSSSTEPTEALTRGQQYLGFGVAIDVAPENKRSSFGDCTLTCWNLGNYAASPLYSEIVFVAGKKGSMGDSDTLLTSCIERVGEEAERIMSQGITCGDVQRPVEFLLVGDMKGKAAVKGSHVVTAKYGDIHCGGVEDALYERLMENPSASELKVGSFEDWMAAPRRADIYLFDYDLRVKLYNDVKQFMEAPAMEIRVRDHVARSLQRGKALQEFMALPLEKQQIWKDEKEATFRHEQAMLYCQSQGHMQLNMPLVEFCDNDGHDALHCKVCTGRAECERLLPCLLSICVFASALCNL